MTRPAVVGSPCDRVQPPLINFLFCSHQIIMVLARSRLWVSCIVRGFVISLTTF